MKQGKLYKIIYNDGERPRTKDMIFKSKEAPMVRFFNPKTNKEEEIHQDKIIRTEEHIS